MADKEMVLTFDAEGRFGALYSDDLLPYLDTLTAPGSVITRRASDVEPNSWGQWMVYIRAWVPGGAKVFGPFRLRSEALECEVDYIRKVM
jgi:hypothetical protein